MRRRCSWRWAAAGWRPTTTWWCCPAPPWTSSWSRRAQAGPAGLGPCRCFAFWQLRSGCRHGRAHGRGTRAVLTFCGPAARGAQPCSGVLPALLDAAPTAPCFPEETPPRRSCICGLCRELIDSHTRPPPPPTPPPNPPHPADCVCGRARPGHQAHPPQVAAGHAQGKPGPPAPTLPYHLRALPCSAAAPAWMPVGWPRATRRPTVQQGRPCLLPMQHTLCQLWPASRPWHASRRRLARSDFRHRGPAPPARSPACEDLKNGNRFLLYCLPPAGRGAQHPGGRRGRGACRVRAPPQPRPAVSAPPRPPAQLCALGPNPIPCACLPPPRPFPRFSPAAHAAWLRLGSGLHPPLSSALGTPLAAARPACPARRSSVLHGRRNEGLVMPTAEVANGTSH